MPRVDITVFNATADVPGQEDATVVLSGAEGSGGVSQLGTSETAANVDQALVGAGGVGGAGTVFGLSATPSSTYVQRNNMWGVNFASAANLLSDTTDDRYIWARVAPVCITQIRNMTGGARALFSNQLNDILNENPLMYFHLHDSPLHGTPCYKEKDTSPRGWRYRRINRFPRKDVVVHIDSDNSATELNGPDQPSSGILPVAVVPNITEPAVYEWWGDYAADLLMGTAFATNPSINADDGPDISRRSGYYTDSTQIVSPNISAKLQRARATGTVYSLIETGSYVSSAEIDADSGISVDDDIYFLDPSGTGFIGYVITSYTPIGSRAIVNVKNPQTSRAASTQDTVPQAGWPYCVANESSTTQNLDWNVTGTSLSLTAGSTAFGTGWLAMMARVSDRTLQQTGEPSSIGGNMLNRSFGQWKDSSEGWPSPHVFTGKVDSPSSENWSEGLLAQETNDEYNIRNSYSADTMMREIGFGHTYINPNPNDHVIDKPTGPEFEIGVHVPNYASLSARDARFIEFLWAVHRQYGGTVTACGRGPNAGPVTIPQFFADLDTNDSGWPAVGVYDDAGGPVGSRGPRGSWTWSTGEVGDLDDSGRNIRVRRIGDWIIAVNYRDPPSSYDIYDENHPADPTLDQITASDWTGMVSGGMFDAGDNLVFQDWTTYINPAVTAFNQSQAPSVWGGFDYGPYQPCPADAAATGTLATAAFMVNDPAKYDGSTLNRSVSYGLPVLQATIWRIV